MPNSYNKPLNYLDYWKSGLDTQQIAELFGHPEWRVYNALHWQREEARMKKRRKS